MDALLGFAVLTGPLWLILILLPVSIWIAFKLAKRFKPGIARIVGGVGIFLLLFLLLFGDEIVGKIYLSHFCATEAGMKVHKTIELSGEYWDEEGRPKFINPRGILAREVAGDRFIWRSVMEPRLNSFVKIDKKRWFLHDSKSNQDLGEKITFVRYYGWLNRFSPAPNVGESCRDIWADRYGRDSLFQKENSEDREFLLKIFTPQTSSK